MRNVLFALALAAAAVLVPAAVAQQAGLQPRQATIPLHVQGARLDMVVHYYTPAGAGPFPTVLYLHGRAPNRTQRGNIRSAIPPRHAQWWLRRGVAVIAPVRPGYGATGGPDLEDTGARWRGGECVGEPDFMRVARNVQRAALAAHEWALEQPWVRRDALLVEGHSLGGLGAVAVAAAHPAGVLGAVNFSGGTAGNPAGSPGSSCRPDLLARTYRELGLGTRLPSLWLYARNDRYWGPQAPVDWHAAYAAGAGASEFVMTAPVESGEGHNLLLDGQALWAGPVDAFLSRLGLPGS